MIRIALLASVFLLLVGNVAPAVEIFASPYSPNYRGPGTHGVIVTNGGQGVINEVADYRFVFQVDSVEERNGLYYVFGSITHASGVWIPSSDRILIVADPATGDIRVIMEFWMIDGDIIGAGAWFDTVGIVR